MMPHHLPQTLAPFATTIEQGAARRHHEPPDPLRGPFELDRHRILTCTAFRRLEQKTQVFAPTRHDHFRTRLTHTLEVAHHARTLAAALGVNESLAESIALAHDLGHGPFGHAGEHALHEAMAKHGGFNHNAHALRVVDILEHPYPWFPGLNLTSATRAGLRVHETPFDHVGPSLENDPEGDVDAHTCPNLEGQVASICDRIAYNLHDIEDALGCGYLAREDLQELELWRHAIGLIPKREQTKPIAAIRRPLLDTMLRLLLEDAIKTSIDSVAESDAATAQGGGRLPIVSLSTTMDTNLVDIEKLLATRLYRHPDVIRMDKEGREMVLSLFSAYCDDPTRLPNRFTRRLDQQGLERVVCDYIAGMTDRFCTSACSVVLGRSSPGCNIHSTGGTGEVG